MQMQSVKSKNLAAIGYKDNTLMVKLHSGEVCEYNNVPENVHNELMKSQSPDEYYEKSVKSKYECKKDHGMKGHDTKDHEMKDHGMKGNDTKDHGKKV